MAVVQSSLLKQWLLVLLSGAVTLVSSLEVGDNLCVEGFIMDYFCISLGFMLDNGKPTLESPDEHSIHCLVDVDSCYESAFEVLIDPPGGSNDTLYTRGYQLTEDSKEDILALARSVGSCGSCVNGYDSSMQFDGFRAVLNATVLDLNLDDDDAPPLITVNGMQHSNNLGDDPCQIAFGMEEGVPAASPTDEPTMTPTPPPTISMSPTDLPL